MAQSSRMTTSRLGNGHLQDVRSLRPLGALDDFELDVFSLFQGLEPFSLQRGVMYEDLVSALKANEPKSFAIVEPFDCTFCFHRHTPFLNGHDELRGRLRNPIGDTHEDANKSGRRIGWIDGSIGETRSITKTISVTTRGSMYHGVSNLVKLFFGPMVADPTVDKSCRLTYSDTPGKERDSPNVSTNAA